MGLRVLSTLLLVGAFVLLLASGTQHEKPILEDGQADTIQGMEATYATRPSEASLRNLAQGYLDAASPGLALNVIDVAPKALREDPRVQHTYARALIDSGRASDALAVEETVLHTCDLQGCDSWLLASAMRRADILKELEKVGVDDVMAHPESAAVAYHAATRQARFVAQ